MKTKKEIVPCICGSLDHKNHPSVDPMAAKLAEHTPTPWKVGSDSSIYGDEGHYFVATTQKRSDADFIVRAVNSHDELLAALIALKERAAKDAEKYAQDGNEPIWAFIADAQDAIAKAEGR